MATRKELIIAVGTRYRAASRQQRTAVLDEFTKITGYHRKHAIRVLSKAPLLGAGKSRQRPRIYDQAVVEVLILLWESSDRLCGKRLQALIPSLLEAMEKHGHLDVSELVKTKLLAMSAASIDRLLKPTRTKAQASGKRRKGSGNVFKKQIPIRTFSDWGEPSPGYMEVDLVEHCGGVKQDGDFVHSLVMTDIASGWTECIAMQVRNQLLVVEGFAKASQDMPFAISGIDTDNGSEFVNEIVFMYCLKMGYEQTRSRPYRKNDQAWVEQKNGSVVRRLVGYGKHTGPIACTTLQQLYDASRLFVNFFQPSFKLKSKHREGAHVRKIYHSPRTRCETLLDRDDVSDQIKQTLRAQLSQLDPVSLLSEIRSAQQRLADLSVGSVSVQPDVENITGFMQSLASAWKTGEVRPTHKASEAKTRTWRTRPDPFESDWSMIDNWLSIDSTITAKEVMQRLCEMEPEKYSGKAQLRTLQRRIKDWRTARTNELIFGQLGLREVK